jgi:hypothetical protein
MPTSSIARHSKIYPNWDFGFEKYHLATLVMKILCKISQCRESSLSEGLGTDQMLNSFRFDWKQGDKMSL